MVNDWTCFDYLIMELDCFMDEESRSIEYCGDTEDGDIQASIDLAGKARNYLYDLAVPF